jgi:hypothetical protein
VSHQFFYFFSIFKELRYAHTGLDKQLNHWLGTVQCICCCCFQKQPLQHPGVRLWLEFTPALLSDPLPSQLTSTKIRSIMSRPTQIGLTIMEPQTAKKANPNKLRSQLPKTSSIKQWPNWKDDVYEEEDFEQKIHYCRNSSDDYIDWWSDAWICQTCGIGSMWERKDWTRFMLLQPEWQKQEGKSNKM